MKKLILSASVAFSVLATTNIYAQQGFGTNEPNKSSAVDIVSNKRGLLIPRIDLTDTKVAAPVTAPANSLLVYNKNTKNDVTPGFYYWEADASATNVDRGRWVRFVASNTGSVVTVTEGNNVKVEKTTTGHDTDYKVSVKGGDTNGLVLVTQIVEGVTTTAWVNPSTFVSNVIEGANGVTVVSNADGKNTVKLGGTPLSEPTVIQTTLGVDGKPGNTLAIKGLEKLNGEEGKVFSPSAQSLVIMGDDGILKTVTPKEMLDKTIADGNVAAKTLKGNGITVTAGDTVGTTLEVANSLLKDVTLGIATGAITSDKMTATTTESSVAGMVPVANADGTVTYKNISAALGAGLTTDGKIVIGNDKLSALANSVLVDTYLSIKAKSIDTTELADKAVTSEKLYAGTVDANGVKTPAASGTVPVTGTDGTVTYKNISTALGEKLTTDGKIVIGDDKLSELANSVLVATNLSIKAGSIDTTELNDGAVTTDKLADNAVTTTKIEAGSNGSVLVTNADGTVAWINQSTLNNKDTFAGSAPIVVNPSANNNATGGKDYTISVDPANGTTEGVVKQAETNPTILFVNGVASVNLENLSSTEGKALTSNSIVVTTGGKALLHDATIEIKGGTAAGQVLVTKVVGTGDTATTTTEWVNAADLGNTVTAANGVEKIGNSIELGGEIKKDVVLNISPATTGENATAAGSLAITGLNAPAIVNNKPVAVNNMVVGPDGKLYTQSKEDRTGSITINKTQTGDINISNLSTYNVNQDEVVIEVTLGDSDTNLILPVPSGVEGQTISVKIVNADESHSGYLNIISGGTLSYGSMPYQGWIIKSNGSKWIIVGRN